MDYHHIRSSMKTHSSVQAIDICSPAQTIGKTDVVRCAAITVLRSGVARCVVGLVEWPWVRRIETLRSGSGSILCVDHDGDGAHNKDYRGKVYRKGEHIRIYGLFSTVLWDNLILQDHSNEAMVRSI